ncbi:MAG: hypothetical protein ABI939_12735, partial [Anaerolineaceae bacterium]
EQSLRIVPPVPAEPAPGTVTARPGPPGTTRPSQLAPSSVPTAAATQPKRFGALIVAGLAGAVLLALLIRSRAAPSDKTAALPFLAVGEITTPELADTNGLGRVLRDMLSTSLGGVEGLQVVANSRLVELMPRGMLSARAVNDAARRAGATEVIEGELSTGSGGMVLSLRRVALSGGIVRKGYIIRAADRYALMDSAGAAIARDLGRLPPSVAITEIRTSSPAAYALYEEGLRANYTYDAPAAYRLMKAALERDSGFAMAAYYVWQLSRNFADESTQAASMARAKQLATRGIERERLLIQGSIAEVDAPLQRALAIAETLTVKYPSDPEGQILLGGIEERAGNWSAAGKAYQRAVTLDSSAGNLRGPYCRICTAIDGIVRAYTWWDSAAAAERTARRLVALRPDEPTRWNDLVEPLLREGHRPEALAAYQRSHPNGPAASSDPVFYRDEIRWGRYQAADAALREDAAGSNDGLRREAWWLLMLSLRDQGRLREADSVRRVWQAADQGRGTRPNPAPDALMIGMELGHPEISIRSMRHDAERTARSNDPPGIRNRYLVWFLSLAGTAYAAAGDTAVLRRLADSVETLGETSQFGRDARLHYFLRGLLLQREGRHAEAVDAFRRSLFSLTDGYTRINLMMARSLLELHRAGEAIAILRPAIHGGVDGSNTYTSRTELHEAMALAFEQAGQADSARVHWRAVESAWRLADPVFRNRYLAAKQRAEL